MSLNHFNKYSELTDEQFLVIGKIIIESSNIDFCLSVLLSKLILLPHMISEEIIGKDGIVTKIEKIKNVINLYEKHYHIDNEIFNEIQKIITEINTYNKKRNLFVHNSISRISDDEIFCIPPI